MTASCLLPPMLEMSDIPTENYQTIDEEASILADHDEDFHGSYESMKGPQIRIWIPLGLLRVRDLRSVVHGNRAPHQIDDA
jgi:hypothetical protein